MDLNNAAMNGAIKPIETVYRGYRFRSRLEARWAVFFDALEIEWQYEVEGYYLSTQPYLPDFWLPKLETFVEIKPTKEAGEQAVSLMKELVKKTGKRGLIIGGSPNGHEKPGMANVRFNEFSGVHTTSVSWDRCILCTGVWPSTRDDTERCVCTPSEKYSLVGMPVLVDAWLTPWAKLSVLVLSTAKPASPAHFRHICLTSMFMLQAPCLREMMSAALPARCAVGAAIFLVSTMWMNSARREI